MFSSSSACTRTARCEVCHGLSRDGAAAVLLYARAVLEEERRVGPGLKSVPLSVFAGRVALVANTTTEGIYEDRVVIAPLYRALRSLGEARGLTLPVFKRRLLEAHKKNLIKLSACMRLERAQPRIARPSAIRDGHTCFLLVHRSPPQSLLVLLDDVHEALSTKGYADAAAFARKVRQDERRRGKRPRLITLSIDAFAARVQAVVNERTGDAHAATLFHELDERGEATGLSHDAFIGRLFAAERAGLLTVRLPGPCVCRTDTPLPIPWGRPTPPMKHVAEKPLEEARVQRVNPPEGLRIATCLAAVGDCIPSKSILLEAPRLSRLHPPPYPASYPPSRPPTPSNTAR